MSVWDIEFEIETVSFSDTEISLYKIKNGSRKEPLESTHAHSYYELHLLVKGEYRYSINGTAVMVRAGEAIIIKPEDRHKAVVPDENTQIACIGFNVRWDEADDGVGNYFATVFDNNAVCPLPIKRPLFHKLLEYYLSPPRKSIHQIFHRKLEACEIIVGLLDALAGKDTAYKEADTTGFDIMLETFISNHSITLSEMASRLGYSERQIERKIRERYGKSLREIRRVGK